MRNFHIYTLKKILHIYMRRVIWHNVLSLQLHVFLLVRRPVIRGALH